MLQTQYIAHKTITYNLTDHISQALFTPLTLKFSLPIDTLEQILSPLT